MTNKDKDQSGEPEKMELLNNSGGRCMAPDLTGRTPPEEALRESLEKYKFLIEATNTGFVILDEGGRVLDANAEYIRMTGRGSLEEILGRPVTDWTAPYDLERNASEVARCLETGSVRDLLIDYAHADGRIVPIEINATVLHGHREARIFTVCRDISERKAQDRSERMLQAIIEAEPECVKLLDENSNLIMMNRAGLDMIQAESFEQVEGRCIIPMVTEGYREQFLDLTKRVFQGGSGMLVFEMVGTKGRRLWMETHAVPLRDQKQGIVALLGVTRDITERKRAEENILKSEEFVRTILNTVDEGFIVIDRDYRIVTANKAYCGQVGETCEKIIGKHCYEISHKASRPCYDEGEECAVREVFANGEPHAVLHKHLDQDGNILFVETKGFPIKDASGNVTSVIETINNITEKHLLEEERLRSQKLESIGTLAGGIAHDFNNLLQGVFGYISMARMTLDRPEKAESMLIQAEKALQLSVNLTSQLLTFSKGGKPVKKRMTIAPVIENAVKFALSGSRLDYVMDIDGELHQVDADEGQLGQVIQNIVLNADQAMPLGGRLEIAARNVHAPDLGVPPVLAHGDYVEISIKDSGIGIPAHYLPRIFDPYFTTKEKGSGLGLATSYSIMKNHGGLIDVSSEVGKGSVFRIYLPSAGIRKTAPLPSPPAPSGRSARILVMDDEEIVRMVSGELIQSLGHKVELAEHGTAAIEKYRQAQSDGDPFDIVILDLTIRGGMGGDEAVRELRAIDPAVKAVVSSGYSDDAIVSSYPDHGFDAFLKKPYDVDGLRDVINSLLK
ncbi:MAG: PAS domain S-box protein [Nitrospirae bacterium]|nr:PAS domain S-box protein [Nitrospirota bacterium]